MKACVAVWAFILMSPVTGSAQLPPARSSAPPPVPTVMRPAEGQMVTGDLAVTVQVPSGVVARKYSLEAAYFDPARNAWVYPGTICPDFGGGTTATTTIPDAVRVRVSATATRWRLHAHATEPPGGWGPWREFTWQSAARTPTTSETPRSPSSSNAGTGTAAPPSSSASSSTSSPGSQSTTAPPAPATGQGTGMMVPGPTTSNPPAQPTPGAVPSRTPASPSPERPQNPPATTSVGPSTSPSEAGTVPSPSAPPTPGAPGAAVPTAAPQNAAPRAPAAAAPQPTSVPPSPVTPTPAPKPASKPPAPQPSKQWPPVARGPIVPPPISSSAPPITAGAPPVAYRPPSGNPGALKSAGSRSVVNKGQPIRVVSRTRLQVWDGRPMPEKAKYFVDGPVDVDWARKNFKWWFDATTSGQGFSGKVRWEISRTPFVEWAEWKAVPGYGYSGTADGSRFFIDLKDYAPIPGYLITTAKAGGQPKDQVASMPKPANASPASPIPDQFNPPKSGSGASPAQKKQPGNVAAQLPSGKSSQPASGAAVGMVDQSPMKLPALLSLYVRVVPLDGTGADADLPSNFVELRFGPAQKAPPFNMDPAAWPKITFISTEYRPVQAYTSDWQCWVKAAWDLPQMGYHKGDEVNTCEHDSDVFSDIADAIGGFFNLLKGFVNAVSGAFDSIKNFATSTIASAIGCSGNATCEALIKGGLDAGLIALGMPPNLPDFDALQAMGEDYLAETIAQQVAAQTGIPGAEDATKAAVKKMIDEGKKAAESGAGSGSFWIPDDNRQYKPLIVMVSASNPSEFTTPAMYLDVTETSTRYNPAKVLIPALKPNESLKMGIALKPTKDPKAWMELLPTAADLQGMIFAADTIITKTNQAEAALLAWRSEYLSGTVTFRGRLTLSVFSGKDAFERTCQAGQALSCGG